MDFEIETSYLTLPWKPELLLINKVKRACLVDFIVLTSGRVKMKDKYLDFARELKKLWTMRVEVT